MKERYHYQSMLNPAGRKLIIQSLAVTALIFVLVPALELSFRKVPDMTVREVEIREMRLKPPVPPRLKEKSKSLPKPRLRESSVKMPMPLETNLNLEVGAPGDFAVNMDFDPQIREEDLIFESEDVDRPPSVRSQIKPVYPYTARTKGIEGHVILSFIVEPSGSVRASSIRVVESDPVRVFDDAAEKAVSRWTFEPGTMQGEPVTVKMKVTINFELDE